MSKANITITGERLAAMYDNDMGVYITPGAEERPYWASQPSFRDDYCTANVQTLLDQLSDEAGWDVGIDDLRADQAPYAFTVGTR